MVQKNSSQLLIDTLCKCIFEENYSGAEAFLLKSLEQAITSGDREIYKEIYSSFNNLYFAWLKKERIDQIKTSFLLDLNNHSNLLINHCSHAAEMDDLLYAFIHDSKDEDIVYSLKCYKRILS